VCSGDNGVSSSSFLKGVTMKFSTVDQLVALTDQIEELTKQANKIKDKLKDRGPGEYEGTDYRAIVREFDRVSLDSVKVRKFLSPQQIKAASRQTHIVSLSLKPISA
jgi:predicted phage-related endonuclease